MNVVFQRDAQIAVQFAAPRAHAAKAHAPPPAYFNPGMSPTELKDAAARGQLPVRMAAPADEKHMRIQDRVKLLQATRAECRDYTAAFVAASKEIADEDAEREQAAEGIVTSRVEERAAQLMHLGQHFADFAHCRTEAGATATARAQLAAEDVAAAKAWAK